jgi:tRNA(Arg) A34 adenosine deaminase TadA
MFWFGLAAGVVLGAVLVVLTGLACCSWHNRGYKRKTALSHAELRDVCAHYDRDAARFRQ